MGKDNNYLEKIDVYKELKEARENFKKGNYITHEQLLKNLGLDLDK
ncbi:MAG: hypothetical protein PHR26_00145 [Candidatus ainarchaeum sp.]|nr:hypothetical protein [Candidatus ainarchaeum sp.]MDD3976070.1 hypothetical protein [Candidatus ainarchaeum sp.]